MVQSEVRRLYIHPTWFICNEDFIVKVFHKIKLNLLYYCSCLWLLYQLFYSTLIT